MTRHSTHSTLIDCRRLVLRTTETLTDKSSLLGSSREVSASFDVFWQQTSETVYVLRHAGQDISEVETQNDYGGYLSSQEERQMPRGFAPEGLLDIAGFTTVRLVPYLMPPRQSYYDMGRHGEGSIEHQKKTMLALVSPDCPARLIADNVLTSSSFWSFDYCRMVWQQLRDAYPLGPCVYELPEWAQGGLA